MNTPASLQLVIDAAAPRELADWWAKTLVLNEPETSLHPSAVRALAPLIRAAARHSQVWVTTHDAVLLDALTPEATVSTLRLSGGETQVVAPEATDG